MAEYRINIAEMIVRAFGMDAARLYSIPKQFQDSPYKTIDINKFGNIADFQGVPIFTSLTVHDAEDYEYRTKGLYFKDTLMDLNLERNIVKTIVQGLNGTIKEFISNGDWEINIMGMLVSDNKDTAPEKQIKEFNSLFMMKSSLRVSSPLLEALGIYSIVVTGIDLPNSAEIINIRPFRITAISDLPIELEEIG